MLANEYCPETESSNYGVVPPKEKLNLWKPVNGSTSSKNQITEVCTIHKKPEEKPKENTINTTNTTNTTNTGNTGNKTNKTNTTNTTKNNTATNTNKTNTTTNTNDGNKKPTTNTTTNETKKDNKVSQ